MNPKDSENDAQDLKMKMWKQKVNNKEEWS